MSAFLMLKQVLKHSNGCMPIHMPKFFVHKKPEKNFLCGKNYF